MTPPIRTIDPWDPTKFGRAFAATRRRLKLSNYKIDKETGARREFLGRIEKGEKRPGRVTVLRIGFSGFKRGLTLGQVDGLLVLAGYAPIFTDDPEDPTVDVPG